MQIVKETKSKVIPVENKMGVMPINKLLINMSLPMMISMIVQALYNVVDSIFVAQISEEALTAVSLSFPIQNFMIAVGAGTGVGINAILSRALGEKDYEKANKTANNGIFLALLAYVLFFIVGVFGVGLFFQSQTKDPVILAYGKSYLSICCAFSFGIFMQMTFEKLLQSTGKTIYTMITQGTGAIINIILDPILIFGLLGAPKMGVAGAAVATVIGQTVGGLFAVYFNFKVNHEIQINPVKYKPDIKMIGKIYGIGLPSIIMQAIGSVMIYGINQILIAFSTTATAVFGVYFKLQSFVFMPVFGLNNGIIPIIAYNYGAGNKERLMKTLKLGIAYSVGIMFLGFLTMQLFPEILLGFFNASPGMIELGVPALRIISIAFVFAGYCIIVGSVFQALGNGIYSMIVSIGRQLVVLLPVAYLLAKLGGLNLVWWAFPIAEIISVILSTLFLKRIYHKIIKHIGK